MEERLKKFWRQQALPPAATQKKILRKAAKQKNYYGRSRPRER